MRSPQKQRTSAPGSWLPTSSWRWHFAQAISMVSAPAHRHGRPADASAGSLDSRRRAGEDPPMPPVPTTGRPPLVLGSVPIGMPAVQAALSGYSDLPMRRVARRHGAPYCLHEVVLDRTVLTRGRLQRLLLDLPRDDHPVGGQLMGASPADFGRAARLLADAGYDVIDLNFGCPVPSVLGRCRGGYLV